jgi:hypothetical protein
MMLGPGPVRRRGCNAHMGKKMTIERYQHDTNPVAKAHATLARLEVDLAAAPDPFREVPLQWIADLHEVVTSIAVRSSQATYLLAGLHGVNMKFLHHCVERLLRDFDGLVAANPR